MKKNDKVLIGPIMGRPDAHGKPGEIKGTIAATLPGHHAVVKLTSISDGVFIAVKTDGNHVILGQRDKLPNDATLLKVGDESTFALADLRLCDDSPTQRMMTYEQAQKRLGKYAVHLDDSIKDEQIKPVNGLFDPQEIETIKTICENVDREQFRFGDEAQEFGKLAGKYMNKVFPNSVR